MAVDMSGYVDVASRIAEFRTKCPEGSLQPYNPDEPYRIVEIGSDRFIVYTAACYRTPDDAKPGIGVAQEAYPGKTPYTRGSEIQNAETSAWGRAIVAALQADTRAGVASQEEVRNRQAEREQEVRKAANALRDKALSDDATAESIREVYTEAARRGLYGATVVNETGDEENLRDLLVRLGQSKAGAPS